jgi:hypothetical protein
MELLEYPHANFGVKGQRYVAEMIAKYTAAVNRFGGKSPRIREIKERYLNHAIARVNRYMDRISEAVWREADVNLRNFRESLTGEDADEAGALGDAIYYEQRGEMVQAISWPYNYMDVYAFPEEELWKWLDSAHTKDNYAGKMGLDALKSPEIRSEKEYYSYVNSCAEKILEGLSALPAGDERRFIFSGQRTIRLAPQPLGSLHIHNLLYDYCNWGELDKIPNGKAKSIIDKIKYLCWKNSQQLCYDILHHVILSAQCSLNIILSDSSSQSLSYFFVRLGTPPAGQTHRRRLCEMDVYFHFENGEHKPHPRLYTPPQYDLPINDTQGVLAFYFKYCHEIYRRNLDSGEEPPIIMSGATTTEPNELFEKMSAEYAKILRPFPPASKVVIPPAGTAGAGPIQFIVAPPGTGKSTYIGAKCTGVKINQDAMFVATTFDGKTPAEMKAERLAEFTFNSSYSRLNLLFYNTLTASVHEGLLNTYIGGVYDERNKIIRHNAKNHIDTCVEEVGIGMTYRPLYSRGTHNACGDLITPRDVDPIYSGKMIFIHLDPKKQYYQILNRSLYEGRVIRFYKMLAFNDTVFSRIPRRYRENMEIYESTNARELRKITQYYDDKDPAFRSFLADYFGKLN